MYACTLTEGGNPGHGEQGRMIQRISKSASALGSLGSLALTPSTKCYPGISPAVMMVSKHVDGSLNQVWHQIMRDRIHWLRWSDVGDTYPCILFPFSAVGSDIRWMFCFLKRVNRVTQVSLLWTPFSFERPSLPHGAAPAADLLTPQRSSHPSLSSWQPGRRAATYLPPSERTSQV